MKKFMLLIAVCILMGCSNLTNIPDSLSLSVSRTVYGMQINVDSPDSSAKGIQGLSNGKGYKYGIAKKQLRVALASASNPDPITSSDTLAIVNEDTGLITPIQAGTIEVQATDSATGSTGSLSVVLTPIDLSNCPGKVATHDNHDGTFSYASVWNVSALTVNGNAVDASTFPYYFVWVSNSINAGFSAEADRIGKTASDYTSKYNSGFFYIASDDKGSPSSSMAGNNIWQVLDGKYVNISQNGSETWTYSTDGVNLFVNYIDEAKNVYVATLEATSISDNDNSIDWDSWSLITP